MAPLHTNEHLTFNVLAFYLQTQDNKIYDVRV